MQTEPLSPELALVDPDLAARARAVLPAPPSASRRATTYAVHRSVSKPAHKPARSGYPLWARLVGAVWILLIGILVGGAAVPHAQDRPRVVPADEDVTLCEPPERRATRPSLPTRPLGGTSGLRDAAPTPLQSAAPGL